MPGIRPGIGDGSTSAATGEGNTEFWRSGKITDELQTGTVTQIFDVAGFPETVYDGENIGGMEIGASHPYIRNAFLIRRDFDPLVNREDPTLAKTRCTFTYQKRPCPWGPEVSTQISLVSVISWWYYSDPPQVLTTVPQGFPLLRPQSVLTLHYPLVKTTPFDLRAIERDSGTVLGNLAINAWETGDNVPGPDVTLIEESEFARESFYGFPYFQTLFEGVSSRLLRSTGDPALEKSEGWYDVSLHFRIDPWRHHQRWIAKGVASSLSITPIASLAELKEGKGHNKFVLHPTSSLKVPFTEYLRNALGLEAYGKSCDQTEQNLIGP